MPRHFEDIDATYQFNTDESVCAQLLDALACHKAEIYDQSDLEMEDKIVLRVCLSDEMVTSRYPMLNHNMGYEVEIKIRRTIDFDV